MASLLLLLLCVITSQAAPPKDTVVLNLVVETSTLATNRIDNSVSRYPPVADYDNLNYFRSRISILNDETLLAGAINKLYHISKDFGTTIASLTWDATDTAICNLAFRNSPFQCGNHIRIHELQSDNTTVLVCGTNAIQPKCRLHNLADLTPIDGTTINPQSGLVPFHPDFKGLTIDNDAFPGGILAVNYLDAAQEDFGISYQFVNITGAVIDNTIQYRSIQGSVNWLRIPAAFVDYYADSYSSDDSLSFYFIFLTENSVEISGTDNAVIYSRVVRICKNDPGVGVLRGSDTQYRADYFKTFVKAYIYCEKPMPSGADSVPGSTSYQYNVIQKVSLVHNSTYRVGVPRRDRIVYGLFTGPTYGPPGSAICVYGADMSSTKDRGIFNVFSEEYRNLRPGQTSCTANNVPNDNPFTCNPATHATSRPMPEFDVLMSPAVSQLTTDPLVELNGITATTIYTTQALACNSTVNQCNSVNDLIDIDVMLVGTDDGKILKIVMTYNGTDHIPLISEELSLADSLPIQNMEPQFVNGEFDHLLLSTDSYIYRLPPQRCDRFETCVDCVKARDPHCFWNQHADSSEQGCKVLQNRGMYDPQTWYQDINYGNVTQWANCGGAVSNFTITSDVVCSSGINIIITPENNENTFVVTLDIEQLSSCGTGVSNLRQQSVTVPGQGFTYPMNSLQPYTWYRVNVTADSGIMRTVSFRTCGAVPEVPSISAIFSTNDGILVYPNIGCLRDDITNYTITVAYRYTPCSSIEQSGSVSLPGASGSVFTITGLGSYTLVSSITVTVQNSFGNGMFTSGWSNRTIEQSTTNSMVNSFSVMRTSSSLSVSWDAPNNNEVCGTLTGYSVYVDSEQMTNCNDPRSYLITGLQSFTQYSVSVTVCTIVGEGPMATVPSGMTMTLAGTPTRLQSITATRTTSSVAFRWNAAQFNGPPGTYEVDYTCYGRGSPVSNTISSITNTDYTISSINCYEADCYARVRASNTAGNMGLYSSEFRGSTSCPTMLPLSASVATNDITVETVTRNSISVNWTVPSDYCGPKRTFIATVTLQGSSTPLCDISTSQNFINCAGLQFSQSYDIRVVTMITCNGGMSVTSDRSVSPLSYTHPCFITDPPSNVAFTRSDSVALTWNPVTNCGNVMYNVYWSCGGSGQMDRTGQTSHTLTINDPASFTYCLGQVQACNNRGCGSISDNVAVLIPLQPPPAVSITGAVNGTTVLIMFSIAEPTDLDDLRYTLYRSRINPNPTMIFTPIRENVSYNFDNVLIDNEPGEQETYEYQLELHNSRGTSPRSNTISVTTTQEPPPGSPMDITAIQLDGELVVEWTAPPSSSPLRYTVQYDTVPPSISGSLFTEDEIELLSLRIPVNRLVFDQACSVRVRARDQRTGFYGAWSYARTCYVNTTAPPDSPSIDTNGLTYVHPLFELKWDPPADSNGFISNYIVELMNVTTEEDSDCNVCNQDPYENSYQIKPDSTIYREVINVTASTCFCAAVSAINGAGASSRTVVSRFYKYEPMIVIPPDVGKSTANGGDSDAAPIVAIVLGVVLVIVALVTLVLAVVFFKLYNSRMKQARASESSKDLNSY